MLQHALAYAEAGWSTFPLQVGGKVPATANGFKAATTDPERIEAWWTENPSYNVGIVTGRLVVIDIDAKEPDIGAGWTSWCQLVADHAPDQLEPETWEVGTPSGGAHLYFVAPAGVEIRNSAGKLATAVDVRATGGYVVAPPSATDAGIYTVDRNVPPAPLPGWLLELLVPKPVERDGFASLRSRLATASSSGRRYGEAALEGELDRVRSAVVGTRNHTLCRSAFSLGQLVDQGELDAHTVAQGLLDAALSVGLTESEAAATIRSGFRGARDNPRGLVA